MTYSLEFDYRAKKEWDKLGKPIQAQFKKVLKDRLGNPHIPSARLHDLKGAYKIKLRSVGYRLVYTVKDSVLVVTVISVGKRDRNEVYNSAKKRL